MERRFTYTKDRLRWILERILENDIRDDDRYATEEHAVEGFEKRAVLDFVLWFLDEAFPENFTFECTFRELEEDYGERVARAIADGHCWSDEPQDEDEIIRQRVVHVDFRKGMVPPDDDS